MPYARVLGLLGLACGVLSARPPLPTISANDNRVPAGTLRDGVLTLHLAVTRGMWFPDGTDNPGTEALTFTEDGHAPSIPGPLIRVPAGTEVRTTVHNALRDSSVVVYGLSGAGGLSDSVRLQPGDTRELVRRATAPGTYLYRAVTWMHGGTADPRYGSDAALAGAFIVDPAGAVPHDRVLVLLQWIDSTRLKPVAGSGEGEELLTINGRSWPHTERMQYDVGDTIRWRVVNASFAVHPMHLHGSFFTVLSHGGLGSDTLFAPRDRYVAVTDRIAGLGTAELQWVPAHAGNWLFHCHLNFHVLAHPPLGPEPTGPAGGETHAMTDMGHVPMGGLILGVHVSGPVAPDPVPQRTLRLVVEQYDSIPGELVPPFSFEADNARRRTIPAAPIVVTQNEPIAITVVNHAHEPTSVHWHGLEIQSYYDGVPGFGGDPTRTTPLVAAGDSFTVRMAPPRAGTFIYHAHYDDIRQLGGGMYGALIVLPRGAKWDAAHERPVIFSLPRDTGAIAIDGVNHPTITMTRGETYRLRLVNITLDVANLLVVLKRDSTVQTWTPIARDGADLPVYRRVPTPASVPVTIGETYDVLYTPDRVGTLVLEARNTKTHRLLRSASVAVSP